ncbi:MAG: hypothetical protein ABI675_30085 [Chitinophagaceae bacterium]
MELAKLIVSIVGLVGTFIAAIIAISSYLRNEKWKRSEFVANKMKDFLQNPRVQNALTLIDWGSRNILLLDEHAKHRGEVRVTRQLQVRALLPHILLNKTGGSDEEYSANDKSDPGSFSSAHAAIRDSFDALLDGFQLFSSYVKSNLISIEELNPYLQYWIDDIHSPAQDPEDAAWSAALLTYIHFYRFTGVQWLFKAFGKDISPDQKVYRTFLSGMKDQDLASQLAGSIKIAYTPEFKTI